MRYDPQRGVYRDCKWCGGRGCLQCPEEADKAYKREFPNGPQPLMTARRDNPEEMSAMRSLLDGLLGKGAGDQLTAMTEGVAVVMPKTEPQGE